MWCRIHTSKSTDNESNHLETSLFRSWLHLPVTLWVRWGSGDYLMTYWKPQLATFCYYVKAELVLPNLVQLPTAVQSIKKKFKALKLVASNSLQLRKM